ncbi:MAG: site-specific integrase [Rikenellaceae bacterium]
MAKVLLNLSTKVSKDTKKSEILLRFIDGEKITLRAKSNIFITPTYWSEQKRCIKTSKTIPETTEAHTKLTDLCAAIVEAFGLIPNNQATKEWLAEVVERFHYPDKFTAQEEQIKPPFFEVFDEFLRLRKLSDVRERNFKVLYRSLQRYELYRGKPLDLDTETDETIRDIFNFIQNEHELCTTPKYKKVLALIPEARTPQPRGHNTMSATFTKLRTFWKWCVTNKKTTNHPKIEVKEEIYGTPFYITVEERKQIERTNLSRHPHLAVQRDVFVFQCLVGCRVGDLLKFTMQDNIVNDALEYVPRKTKEGRPVTVSVPLNSTAKEILLRYKDYDNSQTPRPRKGTKRGDLLPFISEQKYNDSIKLIFRAARINRIIQWQNPLTQQIEPRPLYEVASSHLARRTFVGNIYKQVKDPNLVGALSGHKEGSKAFARYRDIDNEMKKELVNLIN